MENLQLALKRMTGYELKLFKKKLRGNPQKMRIVNYIISNDEVNEAGLFQVLGYDALQKSSFYTLKHRLLRDIKEFTLSRHSNEITHWQQRISNLRNLLYSQEMELFQKEVKILRTKANELELFKNKYEIIFCDYLFHYHSVKQKNTLEKELKTAIEDERLYKASEAEFYRVIFSFEDYFYDPGFIVVDESIELKILRECHESLNSNVTEFFLISAELTLVLNVKNYNKKNSKISEKIKRLQTLYHDSPIYMSFPDCDFAIECLFSKFYYLNGDYHLLQKSINKLDTLFGRVDAVRMYGGALTFYLFIKFHMFHHLNKIEELNKFLLEFDKSHDYKINLKYNRHWISYLWGIYHFNLRNFKNAEYNLIKAKNHISELGNVHYWLQIEVSMMILLLNLKSKSIIFAESELKLLRNQLKKVNHFENFSLLISKCKDFIKAPESKKMNEILNEYKALQLNLTSLKNVNFDGFK